VAEEIVPPQLIEESPKIPDVLPVLPLRDVVVYPYVILPLSVSREKSLRAVDAALVESRMILLLSQKQMEMEDPGPEDMYTVGTAALIMRVLKLPDGRVRALVQGLQRVRVEYFTETDSLFKAKVEIISESEIGEHDIELDALLRSVKQTLEKAVALGKNLPQEVLVIAANLDSPGRLADMVASNLDIKPPQMQEVLEIANPIQRLKRVNELLMREIDLLEVQQKITMEARGEMDKSQREYYLRQQLKAIQQELGEGSELAEEIQAFRDKIAKLKVPQEPLTEIERNLKKLERMHPDSSETAVTRTYLEWMTEMPWGTITEDNLDLKEAKRILDEDHYGLEKIKDRLVEYLAVRKLNPEHKGTILCFVGPPGTGKTSLGRSVARALGRKFARISLGGVHDESEIRGHRRTYVGAMPGRIIQAIHQIGSINPVIMLDEVDKIGRDMRGRSLRGPPGGAGSRAEPHLPRPLHERAHRPQPGAVPHQRQRAGPHPAGVPGPHGDHPSLQLHPGGEDRHRRAPPHPPPADQERRHRGAGGVQPQGPPGHHHRLHPGGRPAPAGTGDRHGLPQGGPEGGRRGAEGQVIPHGQEPP
jgi:ATP-dependent Lon protease